MMRKIKQDNYKHIYLIIIITGLLCILFLGVGSDTDRGDIERAIRDIAIKGYGYSAQLLDEQLHNISLMREQERYEKYRPVIKGFNPKKAQKILIEKFSHIKKKTFEDYLAHRLPWQKSGQGEGAGSGSPGQPLTTPPAQSVSLTQTPNSVAPLSSSTSPRPDNSEQTKLEDECIAEHNKHRRSLGLNELQTDEKMRMAARKHSEHMAKVNQLAHEDIGDGTLSSRCAAEGTRCIGENVAKGMTSGAQAVQAWLKSPGHKANIENSRYTAIGCGFAKPFWWTCVFR